MVTEAPSVIGARAELAVASALWKAGMEVYLPFFSAHSRVDLVATSSSELLRVQCKTSRMIDGVVYFRPCSHTRNEHSDYRGQVDAFGVYSPQLDLVYLVPVAETPLQGCHLRLEPTRNNQSANVRWAADYLIGPP
jgi:hypothetical protein